ncbi:hypothetical protein DD592_27620 [Enterobacter cloacae complex sp. 2DZ2F20B]|nr:hypothetical protein DD592_27620 [Enterobacter cloacae complex sp. 2DZ2F20B]
MYLATGKLRSWKKVVGDGKRSQFLNIDHKDYTSIIDIVVFFQFRLGKINSVLVFVFRRVIKYSKFQESLLSNKGARAKIVICVRRYFSKNIFEI